MRPLQIFIYFATVLLLLSLLALLVPEQGIGLGSDVRLSFVQFSDFNREDSFAAPEHVERLLEGSHVTEDPESDSDLAMPADRVAASGSAIGNDPGPDPVRDQETASATGLTGSAGSANSRDPATVVTANMDSLQHVIYPIQFSGEENELLYPFFRSLDGMKSGKLKHARILHFGDSQIENDRMTALIRYRFQKQFGGTGQGLVQAIPLYSGSLSYTQEQSGGWKRYTFFGKRDTLLRHRSYGIMGAYTAVPPADGEWPMLQYRFRTTRRSGKVETIRMWLHTYVEGGEIAYMINDSGPDTIRNLPGGFSLVELHHAERIEHVKIHMGFPEGGRIYGISFESGDGLQMDNIAMRGSSGLIFSKMDRKVQKFMMDQLSPGLILLQFGGNVVPYMNPGYYREAFSREIAFFKEMAPHTPVIVIGPSDMSVRERGVFTTYPGLVAIRDALKEAALTNGCAFWDLYEAMGGYNSMPSFVNADPPLARPDYIHFSSLGINLVGEMFYNALMQEYREYDKLISAR